MTMYYKVLGAGHKAIHGGDYTYEPGEWTEPIEDLEECFHGYHVCDVSQLVEWCWGKDDNLPLEVWACSVSGERESNDGNKYVCKSIRLDRLVGTLDEFDIRWLGTLFAEDASKHTDDERVFQAINTARSYCVGDSTTDDLDAAYSAVGDAAADSEVLYAAQSAIDASSWNAARSSVDAAAWSAEADSTEWGAVYSVAWKAARRAALERYSAMVFDYMRGR